MNKYQIFSKLEGSNAGKVDVQRGNDLLVKAGHELVILFFNDVRYDLY